MMNSFTFQTCLILLFISLQTVFSQPAVLTGVDIVVLDEPASIETFPNPVQQGGDLQVRVHANEAGQGEWILADVQDIPLMRREEFFGAGLTQIHIPLQGIRPGIYIVWIRLNGETRTSRVVVL